MSIERKCGLIIIDGADGAGKTTLAKKLLEVADKQGYQTYYGHLSKPKDAWQEHRDALLEYVERAFTGNGCLVVADRHFMSESIYGHVYRNGSEYPLAARHVDRLLYRFGALRVIAAPPVDYLVETHKRLQTERVEMYTDGMGKVAQLYRDLWFGLPSANITCDKFPQDYVGQLMAQGGVADKLGWHHYDVTTDGAGLILDNTCDKLLEEMRQLQEFTYPFMDATKPNMTGWARRQSVLLVGDRISDDSGCRVPFFANHGSSLYLAKTLHRLGADESRVCIVNANDPDGVSRVRSAAQFCGRVIALGREAEKALMKMGSLNVQAAVRHPQHARRFTHHDSSYAQELKLAFNGMAGVV